LKHNENLQKGMIITDDFSRFPVLDFEAYTDTIVSIILKSYPKFSIGIYGEWGSRKTTLMKSVETRLGRYSRITCIWFNAWRYEREEQFALIPLLKVLAYNLPDRENLVNIKEILKKAGIGLLRNSDEIISSIIGNYFGHSAGKTSGKVVSKFTKEIANKIEGIMTEIDRDTIYFEGLDKDRK
jgi:predicted KAP-like P-loop ATPase